MKRKNKPGHSTKKLKKLPNSKWILYVIIFAAIGGILLIVKSSAAVPVVVAEPETGKISLNATTFRTFAASGGYALQFGQTANLGDPILDGSHFEDTIVDDLTDKINGYNSLEVTITPEIEQSTAGYYFANGVWFTGTTGLSGGAAYAGFQTNGSKDNGNIGHMALFSVWDVANGIPEPGGWGVPFGGEGTGFSVRISYAWVVGHAYRLKIYLDTADAGNGLSLWAASLTDTSTGVLTRIGRIYVPTTFGKISQPTTFHERYGTNTFNQRVTNCSDLNPSKVKFTNATANNGSIQGTIYYHYYRANDAACPGTAYIQDLPNGYRSSINAP